MPGTPFLMVNGRYYNSRMDYDNIKALVNIMLLESRQFSDCHP